MVSAIFVDCAYLLSICLIIVLLLYASRFMQLSRKDMALRKLICCQSSQHIFEKNQLESINIMYCLKFERMPTRNPNVHIYERFSLSLYALIRVGSRHLTRNLLFAGAVDQRYDIRRPNCVYMVYVHRRNFLPMYNSLMQRPHFLWSRKTCKLAYLNRVCVEHNRIIIKMLNKQFFLD